MYCVCVCVCGAHLIIGFHTNTNGMGYTLYMTLSPGPLRMRTTDMLVCILYIFMLREVSLLMENFPVSTGLSPRICWPGYTILIKLCITWSEH